MKKRFNIFIASVISIAFILMAGGIVANHYIKKHLESNLTADYSSEEQTIGNEVASSISNRFTSLRNNLGVIALDSNVQSLNPSVCNPTLWNYYSKLDLGIGNLGRVNNNQIFYCTINKKLLNKPASLLGTYLKPIFSNPHHDPIVSHELKVPGVTGYVVALHVPVYNSQNNFVGTLGGAVYLNQLAETIFSKVKFAQTGYASVQDDNGDIIYSHHAKYIGKNYFSAAIQDRAGVKLKTLTNAIYAARKGKTSSVTYTSFSDGKDIKKIASVLPVTIVPNHRWIIIVTVPVSEIASTFIHSGLNDAFNIVLLVLGIVLFILVSLLVITSWTSMKLQLAKDQFISLVSHQLRTPLTSIRLFSEMLSDPAVGSLNNKQKEYVEKVHLSTIRMINLVGDILNVSRIELKRLKVDPKDTDISKLIKSEVDEARPLADERNVTINLHVPEHKIKLSIDQTLYGQIIHNLITNAIRYSPEDTGVVNISLKQPRSGGCELVVADNGIGIPKDAQKKIFTRFYRADNAVRTVGDGTGLGLYLIKMIMETTGGNIWFESTENKGTTFHATIPKAGMTPSTKEAKK
jgi:signal transduction histidine kinase